MAQLTNESKGLEDFLNTQYETLEESPDFSRPYSPMARAQFQPEHHLKLEREVGRVFGLLGQQISRLESIRTSKKPASIKYRQLKAATAELVNVANSVGIKLSPDFPEEEFNPGEYNIQDGDSIPGLTDNIE